VRRLDLEHLEDMHGGRLRVVTMVTGGKTHDLVMGGLEKYQ